MHTAIVTMINNEGFFLPLWISHYGNIEGANLVIIDHGTTDGSTNKCQMSNVSYVNVPQSRPYSEMDRCNFVSDFCNSLRYYYDCVIFTDVDEFLVLDPNIEDDIITHIAKNGTKVIAPIGLNVVQLLGEEKTIDINKPVFEQRNYAYFDTTYCKPIITKQSVKWRPGFHYCNQSSALDESIYLFHLRDFDLENSILRSETRVNSLLESGRSPETVFANSGYTGKRAIGLWGRPANSIRKKFDNYQSFERIEGPQFDFSKEPGMVKLSEIIDESGTYKRMVREIGNKLHKIPSDFSRSITGLRG